MPEARVVLVTAFAALAACQDSARMVYVEAGPLWMGSDAAERRLADELSSEATRQARWFERCLLPAPP